MSISTPPLAGLILALLFISCNKNATPPGALVPETSNGPGIPVSFDISDFQQELDSFGARPVMPPCLQKIHWMVM